MRKMTREEYLSIREYTFKDDFIDSFEKLKKDVGEGHGKAALFNFTRRASRKGFEIGYLRGLKDSKELAIKEIKRELKRAISNI